MNITHKQTWDIKRIVGGIAIAILVVSTLAAFVPTVSSAQTASEACSALGGTWVSDDCLGISDFTICLLANNPAVDQDELEASLNVLGTSLDDLSCGSGNDGGSSDNGGDNGSGDGSGDNGGSDTGGNTDNGGSSGSNSNSSSGGGGSPHIAGTESSVAWNGNTEGEVLGTSTEAVCDTPLLYTYLRMGQNNDTNEVTKLQNFLNDELGLELDVNGTFDAATKAAVDEFQLKYASDVLAPWVPYGLNSANTPTGYVYKTTQRKINQIYCEALEIPVPQLP